MISYLKPLKVVADSLYFYFKGYKYSGRGVINWKPDSGFHIEAFLDNSLKTARQIELGRLRIPQPSDYCSIRIWHSNFGWALIPNVNMSCFEMALLQKNLSFKFNRLLLCEPFSSDSDSSFWKGSALYHLRSRNMFQDSVVERTFVGEELVKFKQTSGFRYESNGAKLIGRFIDDDHFQLSWELDKQRYSKSMSWRWSVGFQHAMSIWLGETIRLIQRTTLRDTYKITEIIKEERTDKLGSFLSLFGNAPVQNELVFHLACFMASEHKNTVVCRSMFDQIIEANNQRLQNSQELLVATVLEATMRTLYNYPANSKDTTGLVNSLLKGKFKSDYLSNDWRKPCARALEAFKRLRIRNAHPDWLASIDPLSPEVNRVKAIDDITYLCRFYGYMILALAGFRELQPEFPEPHQDWQPAATITPDPNAVPHDIPSPFDGLSENSSRHEKMIAKRNFDQRMRKYNKSVIASWKQELQKKQEAEDSQ